MAGEKLVCFDFDDTLVNGHFHASLANGAPLQNIPRTQPNTPALGVQVLQSNGALIRYQGDPQGVNFISQGTIPVNRGASPELIQHMIQQIGLKNPQEVAKAMKQAIDNGHKVAVTSFTLYPEVAVPTLKAIMGSIMSPQDAERYVQQICVVGGYPTNGVTNIGPAHNENPNFYGKEEHIQAAMKHFQAQGVQFQRADVMLVDDSEPNLRLAKRYGGPSVVEVPKERNPSLLQNNYFNGINQHVGVNVRSQVTNSTPLQQNANVVNQQQPGPAKQWVHAHQYVGLPPIAPPRVTPQPVPNTRVVASRPLTKQDMAKPKGPASQPIVPPLMPGNNAQQPRPPIVKPQGPPPTPTVQQFQNAQNQAPKTQIPQPMQPPQMFQPPPTFQPPPQTFKAPPTDQPPPLTFAPPPKTAPTMKQVEPPNLNYNAQDANLNMILSYSHQKLTNDYQSFNEAKHLGDKTIHSLFNLAKTAAKQINGTVNKREQQINGIHTAFSALKKDDNIPNDFKAALAFAYLENIKGSLGNQSGMKDLCNVLQSKIESAVPGTSKYYTENNASFSLAKTAAYLNNEPPPKPESTGNKLK